MNILLIEDNISLSQTVTRYLASHDISCTLRMDWISGYTEAIHGSYDVIVLDIGLPGMDGIEICRKLRKEGRMTPIIMLTSRNTKNDIITWLDFWADDYLWKPCDYGELVARIKALSRREMEDKNTEFLSHGQLLLDLKNHTALLSEKIIELSRRENELLVYFLRNKSQIITKTELMEKVWKNYDWFADHKVVEVYIWYLRKKIPNIILTEKGYWYRLNPNF